jgi:hypothetical protein
MADITVQRHGDRWAVLEAGAESPTKEFDTREAAESAARALGGTVEVREDDPTGLDRVQDPDAGEPVAEPPGSVNAVPAAERVRSVQTGL